MHLPGVGFRSLARASEIYCCFSWACKASLKSFFISETCRPSLSGSTKGFGAPLSVARACLPDRNSSREAQAKHRHACRPAVVACCACLQRCLDICRCWSACRTIRLATQEEHVVILAVFVNAY